jgi:hypothetical protein
MNYADRENPNKKAPNVRTTQGAFPKCGENFLMTLESVTATAAKAIEYTLTEQRHTMKNHRNPCTRALPVAEQRSRRHSRTRDERRKQSVLNHRIRPAVSQNCFHGFLSKKQKPASREALPVPVKTPKVNLSSQTAR